MKRIVIDARIINSSTGRYIERLLTYLQAIDKENHYIVLVPKKDKEYWKPVSKNFEIRIADYKNYSLNEQVGYCWFLYKLNADLVHFCMPQQPLFYFRDHITTVHDLTLLKSYSSDKNWFVYHFKQLVGRFVFYTIGHTSRYVITDTDFTKKEYVNFAHIPINKVTAIHLAADNIPGVPEQPQGFVKSDNFLLYVGQQNDYKNIKNLIRSHRQLKRKHPNLKLVLVGSLNEAAKRNKAWAEKENFQDVIFTGFLPDNELAWLYTNTAAYVFPSLMEGFGLPGLEAMGYGAPVVSSNATCLPEVYGDAAHYFNPSDTDDMARAIDEVLSDKALRDSLIQKGYEQVKKYSWEDVARKTLAVYERVLSEK